MGWSGASVALRSRKPASHRICRMMRPPTFLALVSHEEASRVAGDLLVRLADLPTKFLAFPMTAGLKATQFPTEVPALPTAHHPVVEVAILRVMAEAATWARSQHEMVKAGAAPRD